MSVIALDLGGTKLASALVSSRGTLSHHQTTPLGAKTGQAVGALLRSELDRLLSVAEAERIEISGLGVAVPGITHQKGRTVWAPNIPGWEAYPLLKELQAQISSHPSIAESSSQLAINVESDRACYILGEQWRGAARGTRNAIFIAVGTGIGAGILVDGQVLRGTHDIAGAIGWLALRSPYQMQYDDCGCFEFHASGRGLSKRAKAAGKNLSTEELFAAYTKGDRTARDIIDRALELWGMATANLVSIFNPEVVIFGGGVFGPATKLLPQIITEARKWTQPIAMKKARIVPSALGPNAGLLGAAYSALNARLED